MEHLYLYNNTIKTENVNNEILYLLCIYLLSIIFSVLCIIYMIKRYEYTNIFRHYRSPLPIQIPENPQTPQTPRVSRYSDIILVSNIRSLINDDCSICIEPFKENDEMYRLKCGHIFHTKCIEEWININNICPTCREDVINEV